MLQKYGKDRPSVFDLLDTVHRLRGTRSQFSYVSWHFPILHIPPFFFPLECQPIISQPESTTTFDFFPLSVFTSATAVRSSFQYQCPDRFPIVTGQLRLREQ